MWVVGCREQELTSEMEYNDQYEMHPDFPLLPSRVPLTFTLTMKACLSPKPAERPSFPQVLQLLSDVQGEVAKGRYMDATGHVQVCTLLSARRRLCDVHAARFCRRMSATVPVNHVLTACRTQA